MDHPLPAAEAGEAAVADSPAHPAARTAVSPSYRTYVLVVLALVYVVNYLDRQILGILNPQIQAEFGVSNFYIGLLNGPVFALMYATLGIPIAMLADRVNRRNVIAASLALFSLMTFLSGFAARFWQLSLARFGTGIGEAGTSPSINSVLADLYPPEQRASALAFYSAGLNVGLILSFFGGAWMDAHFGWRKAFLAAGIPGFVLALLLLATVREPQRGQVERLVDSKIAPSLWETVKYLWTQKSFRWMSFATSMSSFGGYAGIAFLPKFLETSHHMTITEVGVALSLLTGIVGAIGTFLAGVFADFFAKKDVRWNMYVPICCACIAIPCTPVFCLSASLPLALTALAGPALVGASFVGPAYAMSQALVPLRMRARSAAILLFILNIIGLGTAAPIVGEISDLLQPALGPDSLRYALMTGMITAAIAALCYWQAAKTLKADIARVSRA
jgi:predicted MFS family arabinose efflux permease